MPAFRIIRQSQLIQCSQEIRTKINTKYPGTFEHPENATINGVSHMLWTGDTISSEATARNAVFYGDKAIDRSPCGTGTSARMAQWYAKGKLKKGDAFVHESYIGSQFIGRIEKETALAEYAGYHPKHTRMGENTWPQYHYDR